MCFFNDYNHKTNAFSRFGSGQSLQPLLNNIHNQFPHALIPECCPKCGRHLEEWERRPYGRATRSMCQWDYDNLIANRHNNNCIICGMRLEPYKIQAQYQEPREIKNHMHDGNCNAEYTIVHNVAVGEPEFVNTYCDNNVIDLTGDDYYIPNNRQLNAGGTYVMQNRSTPNAGMLNSGAFPFTQSLPMLTSPAFALANAGQWTQPVPQHQRTHKGKPVRVLS